MILDCHTHIFPAEMIRDRDALCGEDKGFSAIYENTKARMVGVEDLISSMDDSGIERSVICGFSWGRADLCSQHNQYLFESADRYPKRLMVFITFPLSDPERSLLELEKGLKAGAKGVGEIAFYHGERVPQDMEGMRLAWTAMEAKKIPLLLHTNETIGHPYPGKGETPLSRFYELILAYPRLRMILAHWGGGLPFYELMPEVKKTMTQVYYDTAASPFLYSPRIYSIASEIVGSDRILFGSDYPLISPKRYFKELGESVLSEDHRKRILGLNLMKLLELEDRETH
jgi:predicted TIM-barrel fold metal-dependent hydrolase